MRNIMPASSPPLDGTADAHLATLGRSIRARRKELRLSMVTVAESAGISRVTLHRIERGGPAVTMGAYLNVITALGLRLELTATNTLTRSNNPASDPAVGNIRVGDYTQLRRAAWQLDEDTKLTEAEALQIYERNWRHIDTAAMDRREKEFVQHLADTLSHGRILV